MRYYFTDIPISKNPYVKIRSLVRISETIDQFFSEYSLIEEVE